MSSENTPTRERILIAARKLLERNPGGSVRMSDIAKEAGISRQALYLHFPSRTELFIATARHQDEVHNIDAALVASRTSATGRDRLSAFIDAWGTYIPKVYGVAKALMVMKESDADAALAWDDRMQAVRDGCAAAVKALDEDGVLLPALNRKEATDLLWTLLSVHNWQQLTQTCGWPQAQYISHMKAAAQRALTQH